MTPHQKPILSYDAEQIVRSALFLTTVGDGMQTPDRVEKALLGELRRRRRRVLVVQFAAAGALAATVLAGLFLMRPAASVAPPAFVAETPNEAIVPGPPAAAPSPVVAKAVLRRRHIPKPPVEQRIAAAEPNDFIPVGPWQAMEPMERGSIIRVRLPKSSLPGFGIPVSADRWNESVPADVVLGEDGSMRAVRFVSVKR